MRRLIWILLLALALGVAFSGRADEFAGNTLNACWSYANLNESYLLPVRAGDRQQVNIDSGVKLIRKPESADYTLETCLLDADGKGNENCHTGLLVYADGDNWLQWGVKNGIQTALQGVIGGRSLGGRTLQGAYPYIRIQKAGSAYNFQFSDDGEFWETLNYVYTDKSGALSQSSVGLINRHLYDAANANAPVFYAEYAYFKENGHLIPLNMAEGNGWTLQKSKGVFQLLVKEGSIGSKMPRLLKKQLDGDWVLQGEITYDSSQLSGDSHTGLALYADDDNWLIWGIRGGKALELSGMMNGSPTGVLAKVNAGYHHLRIMKRTGDGEHTRYFVYGASEPYYGWKYIAFFEDTEDVFAGAMYGIMGWENTGEPGAGFVTQYDFLSDYTLKNYKDCFESDILDGVWDKQASENVKLILRDGKLTMQLSVDEKTEAFLRILRRPLDRDWIIETKADTSLMGNARAGLALYSDDDNALCFGYYRGKASLSGTVAGTAVNESCDIKEEMRLIRIRKEGQSYLFQYSASGTSWKTAAAITDEKGALNKARYGLAGMLAEPGMASVSFDSFSESVRPYGQIADIDFFEEAAVLTGEDGINKTETAWHWGSGDLGSMFELNGMAYMVFGDTFTGSGQAGNWIRNSIGRIKDGGFTKGLTFDWMYSNGSGLVMPRSKSDDMSMIPVYGFGADQNGVETLYLYIMEIRNWGSGGHWDCNGGAWAVSTDGGWSWKLQPPLFSGNSNFIQLALWQEDEELYMLGTTGGGFGRVCLAKVPVKDILNRDDYRFFTGCDGTGEPVWSDAEADAVPVIDSVNREIAVTYDEYLGVYLMTTLDNVNQQMVLREAPDLWGPWSSPYVLFDEEYVSHQSSNRCFYGSYMLPRYMENGGETVYMTLNKWVPYQISWMKVHFQKSKAE